MRLTILSRDASPMPGGIADHTTTLARHVAQAGIDVTLVTRHGAEPIEGVHVWTHPRFDRMPVRNLVDAIASNDPGVVLWAYNPFSFGRRGLALRADLIAKALRAQLPSTRLVLFAHELAFPRGTEGFRGRLWHAFQQQALRRVLVHVDAVIATTPDRIEELRARHDIEATRIPVGSNLPELTIEPSERAAERHDLNLPPDAFLLAHLGGVGPGRDLVTALTAMLTLPETVHLLCAGDTGAFHHPAELEARLHVPGYESADRLARRLAAADLYLHLDPVGPTPGRRTTLVAALQAGLPIVAFDGAQADPGLVDAGAVRLVPSRNPAALADAVRALMEAPDERARLGRNARALHATEYAWSRITERVISVLTG